MMYLKDVFYVQYEDLVIIKDNQEKKVKKKKDKLGIGLLEVEQNRIIYICYIYYKFYNLLLFFVLGLYIILE